jgi:hypothetical protein
LARWRRWLRLSARRVKRSQREVGFHRKRRADLLTAAGVVEAHSSDVSGGDQPRAFAASAHRVHGSPGALACRWPRPHPQVPLDVGSCHRRAVGGESRAEHELGGRAARALATPSGSPASTSATRVKSVVMGLPPASPEARYGMRPPSQSPRRGAGGNALLPRPGVARLLCSAIPADDHAMATRGGLFRATDTREHARIEACGRKSWIPVSARWRWRSPLARARLSCSSLAVTPRRPRRSVRISTPTWAIVRWSSRVPATA